jgi:hypothetical protein
MEKYQYCQDCKRIFSASSTCPFCQSANVNELNVKAPVNVLGTKVKGRVYKLSKEAIQVLIVDEQQNKSVKEFSASKLRKVL